MVCLGFFPSNDTQRDFSLTPIIHNKGLLLLLPEVAPTALVCWRTKWLTSTRFYFLQEGSNAASFLQLLPDYFHTRLMTLIAIHRALCPLGPPCFCEEGWAADEDRGARFGTLGCSSPVSSGRSLRQKGITARSGSRAAPAEALRLYPDRQGAGAYVQYLGGRVLPRRARS